MSSSSWDYGSLQREMIHYTLREVENIIQSSMNLFYFKIREGEVSSDGSTIDLDVRYGGQDGGIEYLTTGVPLSMLLNRDTIALSRIFLDLLSGKV